MWFPNHDLDNELIQFINYKVNGSIQLFFLNKSGSDRGLHSKPPMQASVNA